MLFDKKHSAVEPKNEKPSALEWPEGSQPDQRLLVAVSEWTYKVFPTMTAQTWGSSLFQFEGRTSIGDRKGLGVTGEIEVRHPEYIPGMLADHWKNVPSSVEGYGFLMHEPKDPPESATVAIHLYCKQEAIDSLHRAFAVGLGSPRGGLGIEVTVSFPDPMDPEFWRARWRSEWWQVVSWKVFAGARLPESAGT
jgi:hypothetical protein